MNILEQITEKLQEIENLRIGKIAELQAEVRTLIYTALKDTTLPLSDRWQAFKTIDASFRNNAQELVHFESKQINNWINKFDECERIPLMDIEHYVSDIEDAAKEEILRLGISSMVKV